jgi:hypothetical protein
VHYLPFWSKGRDDVFPLLEGLQNGSRLSEDQQQKIADAAVKFASKFITAKPRWVAAQAARCHGGLATSGALRCWGRGLARAAAEAALPGGWPGRRRVRPGALQMPGRGLGWGVLWRQAALPAERAASGGCGCRARSCRLPPLWLAHNRALLARRARRYLYWRKALEEYKALFPDMDAYIEEVVEELKAKKKWPPKQSSSSRRALAEEAKPGGSGGSERGLDPVLTT